MNQNVFCLGKWIVFQLIKNKMPFLPLQQIYEEGFVEKYSKYRYLSFLTAAHYASTKTHYVSHTYNSIFYPVSRRRQHWLSILILVFVLEWQYDHTDPIWSACTRRHVQSNCRSKRSHASAGRGISGSDGELWQRTYSRESCTR